MKGTSKRTPVDPARKYAVIYARVSSKEQEKEGFSIPVQLKLLKDYAATNNIAVAQEMWTLKLPSSRAVLPSVRWWAF